MHQQLDVIRKDNNSTKTKARGELGILNSPLKHVACSFPEIKLPFAFNFPLFHFTYLSKYFLKSARSPLLSHTKIKGKHKDLQTISSCQPELLDQMP